MKQSFTMYIYKQDRRCKEGRRLVSTTVWQNRDDAEMHREARELEYSLYPSRLGYTIEYFPFYKTVKSLMTGAEVSIPTDTPRCLDPSSELYWTM